MALGQFVYANQMQWWDRGYSVIIGMFYFDGWVQPTSPFYPAGWDYAFGSAWRDDAEAHGREAFYRMASGEFGGIVAPLTIELYDDEDRAAFKQNYYDNINDKAEMISNSYAHKSYGGDDRPRAMAQSVVEQLLNECCAEAKKRIAAATTEDECWAIWNTIGWPPLADGSQVLPIPTRRWWPPSPWKNNPQPTYKSRAELPPPLPRSQWVNQIPEAFRAKR